WCCGSAMHWKKYWARGRDVLTSPGRSGDGLASRSVIHGEEPMTPDLHFLTICQSASLIKARTLSPIELARAFFARIKALDGQLNAYLLPLEDQAMADAKRAEAEIAAGGWKGPLHGIPIGLKDIYNTAGVRTTGHSALFRDHVPAEDAFTVTRLREA